MHGTVRVTISFTTPLESNDFGEATLEAAAEQLKQDLINGEMDVSEMVSYASDVSVTGMEVLK